MEPWIFLLPLYLPLAATILLVGVGALIAVGARLTIASLLQPRSQKETLAVVIIVSIVSFVIASLLAAQLEAASHFSGMALTASFGDLRANETTLDMTAFLEHSGSIFKELWRRLMFPPPWRDRCLTMQFDLACPVVDHAMLAGSFTSRWYVARLGISVTAAVVGGLLTKRWLGQVTLRAG